MLADGTIISADIQNCRLIVLRPPSPVIKRQIGAPGFCYHDPPRGFGSPNGVFPTRDGKLVVTEITGDWVDVLTSKGRLVKDLHVPDFSYPSDTNEVRRGILLEIFDLNGRVRWLYRPQGRDALDRPSLALPLPNGDVIANDDYNHRVIVVDPRTNRIVWQYGHTGHAGRRPGYLNIPDGVDIRRP